MGGAGLDRALRGDQRLRQHLAAVHALPAVLRRMADETIRAGRLEIEQRHKFVSGHKASTPMRDDLGARDSAGQTRARRGRQGNVYEGSLSAPLTAVEI